MNNDFNKRALINTDEIPWQEYNYKVYKKILSIGVKEETSIIKLQNDSKLNIKSNLNSVEIYVLEGTYINEYGIFEEGTYLKFSREDEAFVKTNSSCTIFRKINYFNESENIVINTKINFWQEGYGNLQVMPLDIQTALVKWPKNERFISHKHWGGEEILVLSGTFIDEYGAYPKGTWIRSPHLSEHFPYVEEETIIFVKTGHL